ncbi:hypothetical protein QE152_g14179 [Popillia japonica]|uniref:Uncharacterized protein n=1 Tax=Popillia japonica TaxID=7064 RepID=A0AAW1L9T2_POPJA
MGSRGFKCQVRTNFNNFSRRIEANQELIAIESRDQLPSPENLKIKILEESEARIKTKTSTVEGAFFSRNYKGARRTTSSRKAKHGSKQKPLQWKVHSLVEIIKEHDAQLRQATKQKPLQWKVHSLVEIIKEHDAQLRQAMTNINSSA